MFDIGWQELTMVIVIAIIVIGPRELPGTLRTIGKYVRKMKGMAREFQGQMDEMAREADLQDLRQTMKDAQALNPKNMIKDAVDPTGDLQRDLNTDVSTPSPSTMKTGALSGTPEGSGGNPPPQSETPTAEPRDATGTAPEGVDNPHGHDLSWMKRPEDPEPVETLNEPTEPPQSRKTGTDMP